MHFDLRDTLASLPQARVYRRPQFVGLMFVAFSLFGLYYIFRVSMPATEVGLGVGFFVVVFTMAFGLFLIVNFGALPVALEVDAFTINFLYANGRIERINWSSPTLRIRIVINGTIRRGGDTYPPASMFVGWRPTQRFLSPEAVNELLRQAATKDLHIGNRGRSFWAQYAERDIIIQRQVPD